MAAPDIIPELDRWYCYEFMLQANTPGERDGRITVWLDGELVADFPNLRLRDVDSAEDRSLRALVPHRLEPAARRKKWYDNVVAATSYIGPMVGP